METPVILTGIRANNDLTLGNYFGAILPMVDMAKQRSANYQINMFIPDLHSFTTPIDHSQLYDQILHNARLFVAAGLPLNNESIHLYRQSYVPAHSELTWILDCFTGFGEMSRMTQFEDKSGRRANIRELYENVMKFSKEIEAVKVSQQEKEVILKRLSNASSQMVLDAMDYLKKSEGLVASVGLFNYPVLMAADILLYNAEYVPVGDDQTQHLEFARDIAERMNNKFGDIFTIPKPVKEQHAFFGNDQGLRIKDLQNPSKKMSKSDDSGKGVIFLGDNPATAAKKVMSATTDDKAYVRLNRENQPGISNLLEILALLRGESLEKVAGEFEGETRYGDFKQVVAYEVERFLTGFQNRLTATSDDAILAKLITSETAMNTVANATLLRAQQAVGLRPKGN